MTYFSMFAVYFIVWWVVLFACLPIGLKTQGEANDIVPGTVESAPQRFQFGKVMGLTTLVSALVCALWWFAVAKLGFGLDMIPDLSPSGRG